MGSDSIGIDTLGVDYIPMHPDGYNAGYCSSGDDAGQYQNPLCAGTVGRNFVTKIKKVYLTGGNQRGDP